MASRVICIRIPDEEVWLKFSAFVARKYGKMRGVIGREVSAALLSYMQAHEKQAESSTPPSTHTHTPEPKQEAPKERDEKRQHVLPLTPTMARLQHICHVIHEEDYYSIPDTELWNIVTLVAGGDERVFKRYRNLLMNFGVLEPYTRIPEKKDLYVHRVNREKLTELLEGGLAACRPRS